MLVACVLVVLAGCAGSSQHSSNAAVVAERVPEDFWLSITVMGPVRAGGDAAYEQIGAGLRPGRYVVEPDRSLRAAVGPAAEDWAYPPRLRRISASEMAEVWSLVRSSGVLAADHPDTASRAPSLEMVTGRTVYVVSTHADGARRVVVINVEPEPAASAAAVRPMIERVAKMAWVK